MTDKNENIDRRSVICGDSHTLLTLCDNILPLRYDYNYVQGTYAAAYQEFFSQYIVRGSKAEIISAKAAAAAARSSSVLIPPSRTPHDFFPKRGFCSCPYFFAFLLFGKKVASSRPSLCAVHYRTRERLKLF